MAAIKVVAFDIGGVYFRWTHGKYLRALRGKTGVGITKLRGADRNHLRELHVGTITENDYWNEFCKSIEKKVPHAELHKVIDKNLFAVNKSVVTLVRRLRKNHKTALLANQTPVLDRLDKKWGVYKDFDYNLSSHIVKLQKPDPAIFKLLLRKARVKPSEALFVDDQQKNIDAAKKLGIDAVLYRNARQLGKELRERKLL